jgi:hypothetical protein
VSDKNTKLEELKTLRRRLQIIWYGPAPYEPCINASVAINDFQQRAKYGRELAKVEEEIREIEKSEEVIHS